MTLVRWDPFRDLMSVHDRFNRFLSESSRWDSDNDYGAWVPPVEVFEKGDDLVIRAEVPGVEKDDLDVRIEDGTLTLHGQRRQEKEVDQTNAYRLERLYGSFNRSFRLPTSVDSSKVSAKYRDGVLEVTVPKLEEAKPKKVEIQVN